MRHDKASSVSAIAVPSAIERNKRKCKCHSCFRRNCAARWSARPAGSMRGLRRFLVFLRLVMPNCATSGRSHKPMVAREVSGSATDDRTFYAAFRLGRYCCVAMTSANAVLPRIVFMKELLSCKPINRPSTGSWITSRRSVQRHARRETIVGAFRRTKREEPEENGTLYGVRASAFQSCPQRF